MGSVKTSIRFFNDIPVRSVWDDDTAACGSVLRISSRFLLIRLIREFIGLRSKEEILSCLQIANN